MMTMEPTFHVAVRPEVSPVAARQGGESKNGMNAARNMAPLDPAQRAKAHKWQS